MIEILEITAISEHRLVIYHHLKLSSRMLPEEPSAPVNISDIEALAFEVVGWSNDEISLFASVFAPCLVDYIPGDN
jgi:hypothetical protein